MLKRSLYKVHSFLSSTQFSRAFAARVAEGPSAPSAAAGWRRGFKYGTAGVLAGVAFSAVTVACKPKDTPDYLLPYYLRDCRSRFIHYASIKGDKGRRYMTPEDFLLALLASPNKKLDDPSAADDVVALFNVVDRNSDGRISFKEFSVLMVLLSTTLPDFELGFRMFDVENKGSLGASEFQTLLSSFGDSTSKVHPKSAIMRKLFGENVDRRCTFDSFKQVVSDLQTEVTKAEFRQFDAKRTGVITSSQFAQLISNSMLGSHLPFFIVENMRTMKENATTVKFSTWLSFSHIMRNADQIGEAIQLFTSSGAPLRRADFNRAVMGVGLPRLSTAEVDLVFALFDKDGDGTLEYEEFVSVMQSKGTFHVKPKEIRRHSLYKQAALCTLEALEP